MCGVSDYLVREKWWVVSVMKKGEGIMSSPARLEAVKKLLARLQPVKIEVLDTNANHTLHDAMRDPQVRVYGHSGTIHSSEQLDIEVNANGTVIAVWFRCQQLPFKQSYANGSRAANAKVPNPRLPRLVAVEVIDR